MKERLFFLYYDNHRLYVDGLKSNGPIFNATELRKRLDEMGPAYLPVCRIEEIFTKPVEIKTKTIYTFEEN